MRRADGWSRRKSETISSGLRNIEEKARADSHIVNRPHSGTIAGIFCGVLSIFDCLGQCDIC